MTRHNTADPANMAALLGELEKIKASLAQKYSFQSVGVFGDEPALDIEGIILFETMIIARAVDWLATLSVNPTLRYEMISLNLQSCTCEGACLQFSQNSKRPTHQFDDKKLLETRIRGAMSDVGEGFFQSTRC
jgi:hypothetical protein